MGMWVMVGEPRTTPDRTSTPSWETAVGNRPITRDELTRTCPDLYQWALRQVEIVAFVHASSHVPTPRTCKLRWPVIMDELNIHGGVLIKAFLPPEASAFFPGLSHSLQL